MNLNLNELINTLSNRTSQAMGLDGLDDEDEHDESENEIFSDDINNSVMERENLNKSRISTLYFFRNFRHPFVNNPKNCSQLPCT